MRGGVESGAAERATVYCVVPRDLAAKLHELLRRHFRDDVSVMVVVERRGADRRVAPDRRGSSEGRGAGERRRIRNVAGRRVGERRAAAIEIEWEKLPRRAHAHAERLTFVERLEPGSQRLEDLDSARLAARFQAGDEEAFAAIYLRYFDRVYNYLRVLLRSSHAAEEATQEVFVKVLAALPAYEHRSEPFRAWLFVVARNHAVSELRKEKRLELLDPAQLSERREALCGEGVDLAPLEWISDSDLLLFIERLPLPQRQVLMLRFMLDLTHAEIAEILGRSSDDVRMLQHRANRFLRERLVALGRRTEQGKPKQMLGRRGHQFILRRRRFALMR